MKRKIGSGLKLFFYLILSLFVFNACLDDDAWEEYQQQQQEIYNQLVADTVKIYNYLNENNITAQKHASWISYQIIEPGSSTYPSASSLVSANYKGYLLDGTVIDETAADEPAELYLPSLIGGWQIGLPLIGEGGKIVLYLPSYYCYGSASNEKIPANSVLIFEIELLDVFY